MTETLYSWVESLVCYYILLSAVTNFLPDNSFKKYIQYYLGLLLILVMLSPVFQVTGIQKEIDRCVEEMEENLQDREAWEEKAESFEENWQTVIQGQEVEHEAGSGTDEKGEAGSAASGWAAFAYCCAAGKRKRENQEESGLPLEKEAIEGEGELWQNKMEKRLMQVLEQVEGIGETQVFSHLCRNGEKGGGKG